MPTGLAWFSEDAHRVVHQSSACRFVIDRSNRYARGGMRIGIALLLLVTSVTASAQNPRQLVRQAIAALQSGDHATAHDLFMQAYALEPSARILRGAATARYEEQRFVEAYRLFQRALSETERPLNARQQREVQAQVEQVEAFVGKYTFAVDPPTAEITIDGRAIESEPDGSVLVASGDHELEVRAEGFHTSRRALSVVGGEVETMTIGLEERVEAPAPAPRPTEKSVDGLGWGLILGGSAAIAAGVGTLIWWVNRIGEVDRCEGVEPNERCLNLSTLESQRRGAATTTIIVTLTGAFALVTGILRWSWSDERPVVACGADPSGAACSLDWRF